MSRSIRHLWVALLAAVYTASPALGASLPPDPDLNENWLRARKTMFGERDVRGLAKDVLRVYVAKRAVDASVVPVLVRTYVNQTPERYIRTMWIMIDNNPSPVGIRFHFSPESGRADIETRVRIEGYTPVRAVAEMNDGSLWMDTATINASGGCSAPLRELPDMTSLGRMRIKLDDALEAGKPAQVQLTIQHPNISGLAETVIRTGQDQGASGEPRDRPIEPQFVRQVRVTYGGRPIMSADVDFTISENPNFRFYFVPQEKGELRAEVVDTANRRFEHGIEVGGSRL
jgi:sulfur-oxidizing protein SoxY